MKRIILSLILLSIFMLSATAQTETKQLGTEYLPIKVDPQSSDGLPIRSVVLLIQNGGKSYLADSTQMSEFYKGANIYPGTTFNQNIANMALRRIQTDNRVKGASYQLYSSNFGSPLVMVFHINLLAAGELKSYDGKKGMAASGKVGDFPMIIETNKAELTFLLNGGTGIFNENNAFFGHGTEFTKGNPIATNPAAKGVRFWGEGYIEPGIAGIIELGKSNIYAYGGASALFSGRNTSDIYSYGARGYTDFEKLYAGLLFTKLGKQQNMTLSVSYGRQPFQLNDGFLISKYSGSANAGPRASVYLNSRTAFQKAGLVKINTRRWSLQGFFLEPEELFKDNQSNIAYAGGYAGYNDNKHFDVGVAYINRIKGAGSYSTPDGSIPKKGLYVINPKLWIMNIAGTGLFFKSEYAYEGHSKGGMSANGWYAGVGMDFKKVKSHPMLYYRFSLMQGDNPDTKQYTRYDPLLTGGLGDWVQGINMRKVVGNGNIVTHRIQAKVFPTSSLELSLDYFHLRADTYSNIGSLAPLQELKSKRLGDEITLTSRWFLSRHFMLLGIASYGIPGSGIKDALPKPVGDWSSVQLAMFMFF